jgi:acyl-CoA synthetase (AMP-forming)/AMP-acid ligase II
MGSHEQLLHLHPTDRYLFNLYGKGLASCPKFPTVHAAVIHHASQRPDALAVRDLSAAIPRTLAYGELLRHANHLAKMLLNAGIQSGSRVPLLVRRSVEMVIGIVGILMAGAQYVPLDGGVVPDETLQHVFRSCCAEHGIVLCLSSTKARAKKFSECRNLLVLDEIMAETPETQPGAPQPESIQCGNPSSGCYVIYTSGTFASLHKSYSWMETIVLCFCSAADVWH